MCIHLNFGIYISPHTNDALLIQNPAFALGSGHADRCTEKQTPLVKENSQDKIINLGCVKKGCDSGNEVGRAHFGY